MKTKQNRYSFSLVLKNIDQQTPALEDSLYESGCDDALINFRNNTVYLDFDREAESLENAVLSAIHDVESSSIGAIVACVTPEDLVSESDIAKRINKKRQIVSLWVKGERRTHHPFPHPIMKLTDRSPFWQWHQIVKWLYDNKLLAKKEVVENAYFLMNLNAALGQRDPRIMHYRQSLLQRLSVNH
ncbi:MAG: DNA-binding protein [Gammaproteobacteria bacterium]|nr:DNA-binding protein [Gammaproteobacteria bacterium]